MKNIRGIHSLPLNYIQFGLLFLVLVIAYAFPGRLSTGLFFMLLAICVVDGLYFMLARKQIRIYINGGPPVEKNDTYTLQIKVVNKGYMPTPFLRLMTKESRRLKNIDKQEIYMLLGPKEVAEVKVYYKARLSGEDVVGIKYGILQSFFGFYKVRLPLEMYIKVGVLPQIREIHGIDQLRTHLVSESEAKSEGLREIPEKNGDEIGYELRPYVEGDSQKLIHWKIAALKDIYLVRQREGDIRVNTDIFLVLNPLQRETDEDAAAVLQDKTITSMFAVISWLLGQGRKVEMACYIHKSWHSIKLAGEREMRQLQLLLSKYHSVQYNDKIDDRLIMKDMSKMCHQHRGVCILITTDIEKKLYEKLLSDMNLNFKWHIIETGPLKSTELLQGKQIQMWHVTDTYEMEEERTAYSEKIF